MIIPAIDLIAGQTVRLFKGDYSKVTYYQQIPQDLVRRYSDGGADVIHIVDLQGARDVANRQLDLMLDGKLFKRYAVGVGRYGKTPLGTFITVVHQTNPDWTPPSGGIIPFGDPLNVLGTRWISIQDDARPEIKGFGIHGTADRTSIGGETSNGCIRMLNEDVEEVFLLIPRGTKVVIQE